MPSMRRTLSELESSLQDGVMSDKVIWRAAWDAADDTSMSVEHRLVVHLGQPASTAAMEELSEACPRVCGFPLPSDLRTLYEHHDGIWTEFCGPGEVPSSGNAPAYGCVVSVSRLTQILNQMPDVWPSKDGRRLLPVLPLDEIRWHGYLSASSIAYFSLEMEQATLANNLADWLQLWIKHGFSDWSYDLPNELEEEY